MELLTVITVIGILAALLLPVLSKARQRAILAKCQNNLHQLSLAFFVYAGDNKASLPSSGEVGNWAWDLNWDVGNSMNQNGMEWKSFYDPGTASRFDDKMNYDLWNCWHVVGPSPNSIHIVGYALTLPWTTSTIATNWNYSLTPGPISYPPAGAPMGASYKGEPYPEMPAPVPSDRPLAACATLDQTAPGNSGGYDYAQRYEYDWTDIVGGYPVHSTSAHLKGLFPEGGNIVMLDGHSIWRNFDLMSDRVIPGCGQPAFWW